MLILSNYLKQATTQLKSLDIAMTNESIAKGQIESIKTFQRDIDDIITKIKVILQDAQIQNIKVLEESYKNEVEATIKIVFADTFDDDFLDQFDRRVKTLHSRYKIMTYDDAHQKSIEVKVTLKLKRFIEMEID